MANSSCMPPMASVVSNDPFASSSASTPPSAALLDFFFPGLSMFTSALQRYLHIDINTYFPLVLLLGGMTFAWNYLSRYLYTHFETHLMSTVEIRYDDEVYNMLMSWVTSQPFATNARRFIVNTVVGSRSWSVMELQHEERRRSRYANNSDCDDDDDDDEGAEAEEQDVINIIQGKASSASSTAAPPAGKRKKPKKALSYTPMFGSYFFWYRGRLLIFRRDQDRDSSFVSSDQRECVTLSCFGRNPAILKALLLETRRLYLQRDDRKTVIYRGSDSGGRYHIGEPTWLRCMVRNPRPLSTVILNEQVKRNLVSDIADYLNPATRRWYANRGIPYRRGYLLYGPPGTGKSSLSVSLAGHFRMDIYMVSLSGAAATEETLAALFNNLPRRCIVLLEDIDTAGLTHTREDNAYNNTGGSGASSSESSDSDDSDSDSDNDSDSNVDSNDKSQKSADKTNAATASSDKDGNGRKKGKLGRLSLSGLLNILDGVASQEGRILIMTTNHLEKLDKALIRPGRVDITLKFDLADRDMVMALFRSIFSIADGDGPRRGDNKALAGIVTGKLKEQADSACQLVHNVSPEKLDELALQFADKVPALAFSPAELQGYLLKHKNDPAGAVAGVEAWMAVSEIDHGKAKERSERRAQRDERKRARAAKHAERKKLKEKAAKQKKKEEKRKKKEENRAKLEADVEAEVPKGEKKAENTQDTKKEAVAEKESMESESGSEDGDESDNEDQTARKMAQKKKQKGQRKQRCARFTKEDADCSPGATSLPSPPLSPTPTSSSDDEKVLTKTKAEEEKAIERTAVPGSSDGTTGGVLA